MKSKYLYIIIGVLSAVIVILLVANGLKKSQSVGEFNVAYTVPGENLGSENTNGPIVDLEAGTEGTQQTEEENGKYVVFIKKANLDQTTSEIITDYLDWNDCTLDMQSRECMNGFNTTNSFVDLHTLPVSSNVVIKLQTYTYTSGVGYKWNQEVPLSLFASLINNSIEAYPTDLLPFWITVNNGIVTEIVEQYLP